MVKNENSSIIRRLKINYDDKNGAFDLENNFPEDFSIEFNKFDNYFNIRFNKQNRLDNSYPVKSADIYVIDQKNGQPVLYQTFDDEVKVIF